MSQDLTLLRLEYKIDLILRALQDKGIALSEVPQMVGIEQDPCPVCRAGIRISIDPAAERLTYSCGCTPPISVVRGISSLLDPPASTKEKTNASTPISDHPVPSEPEEGGPRRR